MYTIPNLQYQIIFLTLRLLCLLDSISPTKQYVQENRSSGLLQSSKYTLEVSMLSENTSTAVSAEGMNSDLLVLHTMLG